MDKEHIVDALNDLLTRNYDAEKGYTEAGNSVRYGNLRMWFFEVAEQRKKFGHEIKSEIKRLGGTPDKGGSFLGDLHRAWMDLKADLSANLAEPVLEECARGEDRAMEDYNKILEEVNMDDSTRVLLTRQYNEIREAKNKVLQLEAQYEVVEES